VGKKDKKEKKDKKTKKKVPALGWRGWIWRLGLSGVGGVAVFLAFPTFDLWPLAWVAMVPTLFAVEGLSPKRHFWLGLWAGFITNLGGFYWMTGMLMDFGHLPWAISFALNALLAVYQGLVFALWLWLLARLRAKSKLGTWLLAPMAYVAAEFAIWFLFPWFYANSQYLAIPMIQICELGGVMLLSFLLVAANGALFDGLRALMAKRRKPAIILLAAWLLVPLVNAGYGLLRMHMVDGQVAEATKLRVGMVEADVGIRGKEDRRKIDDNLVRNQRLSVDLARQGAELIVWPETAYPSQGVYARVPGQSEFRRYGIMPRNVVAVAQSSLAPPEHASEDRRLRVSREDIKVPQRGFTTPLLFGALTYRENPESRSVRHPGMDFLNTAILIDDKGEVLGVYDKVHRLMFGEYVPFSEYFPQIYEWVPEAGDLSKGTEVKSLPFRDFKLGIMVCYEDILPAFGREFRQHDQRCLVW